MFSLLPRIEIESIEIFFAFTTIPTHFWRQITWINRKNFQAYFTICYLIIALCFSDIPLLFLEIYVAHEIHHYMSSLVAFTFWPIWFLSTLVYFSTKLIIEGVKETLYGCLQYYVSN